MNAYEDMKIRHQKEVNAFPMAFAFDDKQFAEGMRTHIRRHDHIVKFAAYFILCLHWFNPLVWASFLLMSVDMEMSCDERVLKEMGSETKHDYSRSLLSLATERRVISGSPLAFGEGGVKERVKNVLNFRKPSRVIIVAAVALVAVLSVGFAVNKASDRKSFTVPYFSAGGLTLGYYIQDMDLSVWKQADASDWEYTSPYGAFRINNEGRIDKFTVYVHAFTEGIWTMSGIEPSDWFVNNYVFHIPAYIDDVLERFGEGSERYDAPENSKDVWSYVRYEDKQAGIAVRIEFHKENSQVAFVTAEGLPPAASRPTPAPPAVPLTGTVSIIIWKDDNGQTRYSLFDGNVTPAPSELSIGRAFNDIAGLNAALAKYPQDLLNMAYIQHTMDITKDEAAVITESIVLPSDNYSKTTGYYEFHITTLDEAQEIVNAHYPNALDVTYLGDETISYTNPPAPVECYMFEVHSTPGQTAPNVDTASEEWFKVAVSKERGIFFTYTDGTWWAFTGLREWSGATQNMTLDDVRAIAQKIGPDLAMGDLRDFIGTDVGSGIFMMLYEIVDSDYVLLVGSVNMTDVSYAYLQPSSGAEIEEAIDIRYYDVDKYLTNGTRMPVRPLPGANPQEDIYELIQRVENSLSIIMSSPLTSSNPQDYINAHQEEYENLTAKYSEGVLEYLLSEFETGNSDGLRGHIMMRICKDILGLSNNVTDESLSPQAWYSQLSVISQTWLPDFEPDNPEGEYGGLAYSAITQFYSQLDYGFLVSAPTVYGAYEEEGKLKIFMTVYYQRYRLFGKTLESTGGGIIPGAAIFKKDENSGEWVFEEYLEVGSATLPDGMYFNNSIQKLCVTPVSGQEIKGLAKTINDDYVNEARQELLSQNLIKHLLAHGQTGVSLRTPGGDMVELT